MSIEMRHRRWRQVLCSILLICLSLMASFVSAQNDICPQRHDENSSAYKSGQAFLATDRLKYSMDQSIVLYAGVRNIDNEDSIYIYRNISWGYGGGLVLHVRDDKSREVAANFHDDTMLPPPKTVDSLSIFVELKADEIYGMGRALPLADLIKLPGRYYLQVEYRSPLACSFVDAKIRSFPVLWHENASMLSNVIEIEVTR